MAEHSRPPILAEEAARSGLLTSGLLVRNSLLNVTSAGLQLAGKSLSALLIPFLLTPDAFGAYAYLLWISGLLTTVSILGLPQAAQRFLPLAGNGQERQATSRFIERLAWGGSLLLAGGFVAWNMTFPGSWSHGSESLVLVALWVLLATFGNIRTACLKGCQNFSLPAKMEGLVQTAKLLILLGLLAAGRLFPLIWILALEAACVLLQASGLHFLGPRGRRAGPPEASPGRAPEILRYTLTAGAIALIDIVVWQRIEIGFLEHFGLIREAGYFLLASHVASILTLIPATAVMALFPSFAALGEHDPEGRRILFSRICAGLWVLAVPLLAVGLFIVPSCVRSVYGETYGRLLEVLPFVLVGRTFLLLGSPASTLLYAAGLQGLLLKVVSCGAVATFVLDYVFISRYHMVGAGIAVITVQPLVALWTIRQVHRRIARVPLRPRTIAVGLAAVGAGWLCRSVVWEPAGALVTVAIHGIGCWADEAVRSAFLGIWRMSRERLGRINHGSERS